MMGELGEGYLLIPSGRFFIDSKDGHERILQGNGGDGTIRYLNPRVFPADLAPL